MKKRIRAMMIVFAMLLISACGNSSSESENVAEDGSEEPAVLEVEFDLPGTAKADETVEPKATVTYGGKNVNDADEVKFEYWEKGNEDNSTTIEANNNKDGTYTAEVSFENDGVYEMYAHTTARDMHTMPKKSITIGDGGSQETEKGNKSSHNHDSADGFNMDFSQPDNIKAGRETNLTVQLQMDGVSLEAANVRYEITSDDVSDFHEWIETNENEAGKYSASYVFNEPGTYTITVHVENDNGLHEHEEHEVKVN